MVATAPLRLVSDSDPAACAAFCSGDVRALEWWADASDLIAKGLEKLAEGVASPDLSRRFAVEAAHFRREAAAMAAWTARAVLDHESVIAAALSPRSGGDGARAASRDLRRDLVRLRRGAS